MEWNANELDSDAQELIWRLNSIGATEILQEWGKWQAEGHVERRFAEESLDAALAYIKKQTLDGHDWTPDED